MKILIIGSGGRECALAWRFLQDENVSEVIVSPGNTGMALLDKRIVCLEGDTIDDFMMLAKDHAVDFTFVGPEHYLVQGIVDSFQKQDLPIVGPSKIASLLEGSKIFAKEFMDEFNIPTARFKVAHSYKEACDFIDHWLFSKNGFVIKADGLAGGKGVVVARNEMEAKEALHSFMVDEDVSVKSRHILLEEVLIGREASFFALCDGNHYQILGTACDHKRLLDQDKGPNTGGMGCFHDPLWPTKTTKTLIETEILQKTLEGMTSRGTPFHGILFIGVMIDEQDKPFVVEYNVRFGDPETQTLMPLIRGNLSQLFSENARGAMNEKISIEELTSLHVVMTSGGYPSIGKHPMELGNKIVVADECLEFGQLFYAGVSCDKKGTLINSGGRVLGISSTAPTMSEARSKVYKALKMINFSGQHYRSDIGKWRL